MPTTLASQELSVPPNKKEMVRMEAENPEHSKDLREVLEKAPGTSSEQVALRLHKTTT